MTAAPDKTARIITKLTEALRAKDAEIARRDRADQERLTKLERIQAVLEAAAGDDQKLRDRLQAAESRVVELDYLNTKAADAAEELSASLREATEVTAKLRGLVDQLDAVVARVVDALGLPPSDAFGDALGDAIVACIALHRENTRLLEESASSMALVEQQRTALTHILDEVRPRMRKRQLEEERAILNRKALVTAAPGRNLR